MKRIEVSPGKFVAISPELAEKAARLFTTVVLTREQIRHMAKAEPKGATVFAGPVTNGARRGRAAITTGLRQVAAPKLAR